MSLIAKDFILSVTPGAIPPTLDLAQYDDDREFVAHLYDDTGVWAVPSGAAVTLEGTNRGGIPFEIAATYSGNTVTFTPDAVATDQPGKVYATLVIKVNGKQISTLAITLDVQKAGATKEAIAGAPGFEDKIDASVSKYLTTTDALRDAVDDSLEDSTIVAEAVDGLSRRAPYVNKATNTWMEWSAAVGDYVDSGTPATGESAVHSVNGQTGDAVITVGNIGAAYGGDAVKPMDDPTANELLDCIYSYIDNADKLFYGGMNARYIADCTDLETVKAAVQDIVDVSSATTLGEIKETVDALTDVQIDDVRSALHIGGNWAKENPRAAVDYLLSGRKPIHCAWFAYLVSSGIRYETSLYPFTGDEGEGNQTYSRFYDWGFNWPGLESYFEGKEYTDIAADGHPLASKMAKYCVERGYGFELNGDYGKLRTGDVMFISNGYDSQYRNVGHCAVFITHTADKTGCIYAEVGSSNHGDTFPVHITREAYSSNALQKCEIAARLPYAGSARIENLTNLFSNEAAYRNAAVQITNGGNESAIFAIGKFSALTPNRFYTLAICLDRSASVSDSIALRGVNTDIKQSFDNTANRKIPADGVVAFPVYNGIEKSGFDYKAHLSKDGISTVSIEFREYRIDGMPTTEHTAMVKWIACYEGIHHVGRGGFIPYDDSARMFRYLGPVITAQPEDASVAAGESATFAVSASGLDLAYQWQYNNGSTGWNDCTSTTQGYNTNQITVESVSGTVNRNGYRYRCRVTAYGGLATTSDVATLTVTEQSS